MFQTSFICAVIGAVTRAVLALVVISVACGSVTPVVAAGAESGISAAQNAGRKVKLAGRQRMLTQLLAKSACFASIGIDVDLHLQRAALSHYLFDETLKGLRQGSDIERLLPERNDKVVDGLKRVESLWAVYGPAVQRFLGKPGETPDDIETVFKLSVPILISMEASVRRIEAVYSQRGDVDQGLSRAINVASRQRMLSQKAAKEFCIVAAGYEVDQTRGLLADTLAEFSRALDALESGDEALGVPPAPVSQVAELLRQARRSWQPIAEVMKKIADGGTATPADIALVARANEQVLKDMNEVVGLYEALL